MDEQDIIFDWLLHNHNKLFTVEYSEEVYNFIKTNSLFIQIDTDICVYKVNNGYEKIICKK
jgi:hypothetical protein